MLGNIKFIGELGKLDMVQPRILHQCIKQLLAKKKRGTVADMAEDLECLCQIMRTVGRQLDHDQAKLWMDQYFVRMQSYKTNRELPSRIRFMLQDVTELRENDWVPRKISRENGPKTIQQVHNEAARETGQAVPSQQHHAAVPAGGFNAGMDLFGRPMNGIQNHHRSHGPMSDMFGPAPTSPPVMGGIGTGPGVIPMDQPFGSNYRRGGRGFQNPFNNRGGGGGNKFGRGGASFAPRYQEERSRTHDDSSDEEGDRAGSGSERGGSRGNYRGRGQQGYHRGSRQPHTQNPADYSRGQNYQGGYASQQHSKERGDGEEFAGRGGFHPRGRGGYDRGRGRGRGAHYDNGQPPYNNDNRQTYNNDNSHRQNYNNDNYRQPYNDTGYQNNYNQQNFRQQQQHNAQNQKDIEKLPPRFRKQLELQQKQQDGGRSGSPPTSVGGRASPQEVSKAPVSADRRDPDFLPFQQEPLKTRGSPVLERASSLTEGSNSPPPTLSTPTSYTRSPNKMEEISLRPVRMPAAFRPNIPSMLPKSAQGAPPPMRNPTAPNVAHFEALLQQQTPKPSSTGPTATNLTIKTVPAPDKAKDKKKSMSQDELRTATDKMLKEFLESGYDLDKALKATREIKPPKKLVPDLVTFLVLRSLDQSDTDRENVGKLISAYKEDGIIDSELFMEGLCSVLDQMKSLEAEVPLVKSYVSKFAALAVSSGVVGLTELADPLENGRHYPLFLLCLQQIHKLQGKDWLVKHFNDSSLDLQKMLPECDQSKERMLEVLEDRGLSFMFPLLQVQSDLWRQINSNPNPTAIYKWIKDNCTACLHADPKFINIVFSNVIKYIVTQTTLAPDVSPDIEPEKHLIKKEKELASKLKGVLAAYVHDSISLQLVAIYAVQVFCHSHSFPKGMLLRLFMYLYDLEIIDEEAFLKWKEDINDQYPGKGKALFQVNQWLLWLEQADSESSEED